MLKIDVWCHVFMFFHVCSWPDDFWWFTCIFYIYFYKILTVFDRCATEDYRFGSGFYNIIIHYIISCYLSLAFVGDVCGIFVGCAYRSDDRYPIFTKSLMCLLCSRVFASYLWYLLLILCIFDVLMEQYICMCSCVSISYKDFSVIPDITM